MPTLPPDDEAALTRACGARPTTISLVRRGGRCDVLRCHFDQPATFVGGIAGTVSRASATCIVKRATTAQSLLHHERAGLEALRGLAVPALLAVLPGGALVMEDLGATPDVATALADVLDGSHRPVAQAALIATAAALGALHAQARQRCARYALLDPTRAHFHVEQAAQFRAARVDIERLFAGAGVPQSAGFDAGCDAIARHFAAPGAFATITVGDMAPSNVVLAARGPVFIDLEYCAIRHAFYDAMFWRCICPFPVSIADDMDRAYLAALRAHDMPVDDEQFARQMVLLAGHRLLWMFSWGMDGLFANDRDWARPGQSTRTMLLRYIADYLRFSAPRPHDRAVRSRIADLGDALAVRWRATADGIGAQVLDKTGNEPFAVFNAAPAGA